MNSRVFRIGVSVEEVNNILGVEKTEIDLIDALNYLGIKYKIVHPKKQFLASIKGVIGKPYKRGASVSTDAPEAFDCSSLIAWAAVESGYSIPRVSIDQYVYCKKIDKAHLEDGDLVFANTKEIIHTTGQYFSKILNRVVTEEPIRTKTLEYLPGTKVPEGVDHVGVYIENNKVIHCSIKTGGVVEQELDKSDSFKNIIGFGRFIDDSLTRLVIEVPRERSDLKSNDILMSEIGKFWQINR